MMIGPKLLLFTLVLVWAGDTLAYFVGRSFGRIPMAPQLSPKKTWEGAAANLLGFAAGWAAFAHWLPDVLGRCDDGWPGEYRGTDRRSAGVRLQARRGSEGLRARSCRDTVECWIGSTP